jgi:hypothetical protein
MDELDDRFGVSLVALILVIKRLDEAVGVLERVADSGANCFTRGVDCPIPDFGLLDAERSIVKGRVRSCQTPGLDSPMLA